MVYEEYIKTNKAAFIAEVKRICALLNVLPDWMMTVMMAESTLNEKAINSKSNATGLIQFMPDTALALGTTVAKLKAMSNVEQLAYVYKYFLPYKGKMNSVYDMYKAVFFPISLGKPSNWVLQSSTQSAYVIYRDNKIMDTNGDQQITVAEVEGYIERYIKKKLNRQ